MGGGWLAGAAPLQRGDVAAAATWVAHVDCDGLRPTGVGQYLQEQMEKPDAQTKLAAFQAIFGFDLRKQLHGLTLYSTGSEAAEGVLLVYADFDPDRLVTLATAAKDHQSTNYKKHVIHSWIDEHKKAKRGTSQRTYAAIQGPRVIFGQQSAAVEGALDVLDGTTANLSGAKEFAQLGAPGDTSLIEGVARTGLISANADSNAALLGLSRLVRLQVGESRQQVSATLILEAKDQETAAQIDSIAQGLVALMKLQSKKPEGQKLAQALKLRQDGSSVVATLTLPDSDVVAMMKADADRKAARKSQAAESVEDSK